MNEDYGNLDQMNMFAQYAFNAGATVVPMRPVGFQRREVVLDNVSSDVTWSGGWNNSTQTIYYGNPGEVPYRWASLSSSETATASYVPNIPEDGFYPVYTWVRHGSDRTFRLYRIRHLQPLSRRDFDGGFGKPVRANGPFFAPDSESRPSCCSCRRFVVRPLQIARAPC